MSNSYYLEEVKDKGHITEYIKLLGFKLGNEIYAIDVMEIEEIIRFTEITSIPRADKSILGVINLRGRVVPVVDLRIRFNLDKYDFDKNTSIVVLNFDGEYIGFVVDSVTEVMNINKKNINPNPPLIGTIGQEYILGIYRIDNTMVFILDIDRMAFPGDKYETSRLKKEIEGKELESKEEPKEDRSSGKEEEIREEREIEGELSKEKERKGSKEEQKDKIEQEKKEKVEEDKKTKDKEAEKEKDIDKLIEEELKKREKETEELLKRKKEEQKKEDSKKKIDNEKAEVNDKEEFQGNIDQMIASEFSKKGKEDGKKEESESKKEDFSDESEEKPNIKELRKAAKNIIEADKIKSGGEPEEEIEEYVKELEQAKGRYESHINALINVKNMLPKVAKKLRYIDEVTSKSTDQLFNVLDSFNHFYEELLLELDNFSLYVDENNLENLDSKLKQYEEGINEYKEVSLQIYEALEFEDISDQTIKRVLKLVSDVKANFSSILGYVKKKENDDKLLNQEEIDKILNDFGLD